jgi:hypothetical protein
MLDAVQHPAQRGRAGNLDQRRRLAMTTRLALPQLDAVALVG